MAAEGENKRIAVVGTTTWGSTLAIMLARRNLPVTLWARTEKEAQELRKYRENRHLLPGFSFPRSLDIEVVPRSAHPQLDMVVFAVPSKSMRQNAREVAPWLNSKALILSATKGLEAGTAKRMSQVLEEELGKELEARICVLSGPNLATEIAAGQPASAVAASRWDGAASEVQGYLNSNSFRVYTNSDVVGVEMGGALKNIVALAVGICDGLDYGDNAKAALMTRGLVEITRLGVATGAEPLTFAGLAGLGDLIATCSSPLSRNHYVGEQLGKGRRLPEILASMRNVAEGVDTTVAALKLAKELGVEMPITELTYKVLFKGLEPREAANLLMERSPRAE